MIRTLIAISLFLFSLSFENRMAVKSAPQPVASKPAPNPNQWALLIGVSNYPGEIQDLRFAGVDARSIKDLLVSSAGFGEDHVRLLTDDGVGEAKATRQNIFAAIDQYLAPRVQPGHEIIIFLAGHGVVRGLGPEAKSYYLPVDTDAQTKESLERTAIDLEDLSRRLSTLRASQFTIFYDACREDPFPGRGLKGNTLTDVTARLLTTVSTRPSPSRPEPPTSVIFYACQVGERAYENAELQHGVFTYYILRGLRELAARPDGRIEAGLLAGFLSENVRKWTKEQAKVAVEQNPTMVATEVRGPVLIARVQPLSSNVPTMSTASGLLLNTSPEGATISINSLQAGRGPLHKELAPNQYTIRAEMAGFQAAETKVNVISGYQQEITITLQPLAGNSNYEKGIQFEKQMLWPQAIASYEQSLRDDPNSVAVYERLAQAYVKNGRYGDAVNLLTVAAQKFPDNALILARRSRARSSLLAGDDTPAVPLAIAPTGQSFAPAPAEESGKKGKKSKKKSEEAEGLEEVKSEKSSKKSKKKSEEEVEGTEEVKSEKSEKSEKSGKKSKSGKNGKKSKSDYDEETQGRSLMARGSIVSQANATGGAADINEAIRDAELAIQKDPRLAEAHLALGFACLADQQYYDRALAAFVQASTIAPEDAEAYFGVGYVYRLKLQYQQAVPQLKKAIDLRRDYYEAQRELAYCYHAMGNTDQAIRQYVVATSYRAATKDSGEMAANNLALATLYKKKGDEMGGVEGEEYRKTSKACEDDAREQEPDLKIAVKKLSKAGVSKYVEDKVSPDIRKIMDNFKFLKGDKSSGATTVPGKSRLPIDIRIPIKTKNPIDIKVPGKTKTPIDIKVPGNSKSPINIKTPIDIKTPIKIKNPKSEKSPKDNSSSPKDNKGSKDTRTPINKSPINIKIPINTKSSKDSKSSTDTKAPPKDTRPTSRPSPKVTIPLKKLLQ